MSTGRAALRVLPPPPPPERLPSPQLLPPEQLAGLLLHYRSHGTQFDHAWELSLRQVQWPASRRDASEWKNAIADTRESWRAAYEGWPADSREQAVTVLGRLLTEVLREDEDYELDTAAGF